MKTTRTPRGLPAFTAYREHLNGDCWACSTGRWCQQREQLDHAADIEARIPERRHLAVLVGGMA